MSASSYFSRSRMLVSLVMGGLAVALATSACSGKDTATTGAGQMDNITSLQIADTKVGTGAEAKKGNDVTVHYTGWLYDPKAADKHGTQFDSSRKSGGQPFSFRLGAGQVIQGWDQGVAGMKVGGQRTLVIPSPLGYGARGAGGAIPPNATLVFDVELLDVK
jgi:FKBP-type peptidyl-prolyl cis-trans isomerase FkpA